MNLKSKLISLLILILALSGCVNSDKQAKTNEAPFIWDGANVYFLLTDRFNNGDKSNDVNFDRTKETAKLRGFEGGDIKGVTQKIKEGYFNNLGINAIWMTPITEQIHGAVDEGTGATYGFHGYWAKDWTALDPNFGTKADLAELVEIAHAHGIRILLDGVINHTGPATEKDPAWEEAWVRTCPTCDYTSYKNTIECTLTSNLPDVKTESIEEVNIPAELAKKWKAEGRYDEEMAELDAFFQRTGYPRTPKYHLIKWMCDYITEFGIDGYRADTVKHTEESVWADLKKECDYAFRTWKKNHPDKVLDGNEFYLVGEVYNFNISAAKAFDFGDKQVNYFDYGFNSMINFEFKYNAKDSYEDLFSRYSTILNEELKTAGILNYLTSHDDGSPFDSARSKTYETATKLLLCPGTSQVYYGDESARSLEIEGAEGDATLRSFMNWDAISKDVKTQELMKHWQKLGQFRRNHPAVGAGVHQMISEKPYVFARSFAQENYHDYVVVALDLEKGKKEIPVAGFEEGIQLRDAYSGKTVKVANSKVILDSDFSIVLLEKLK
ncbi:alpha-amylase family glycosyl hydrolase [Ancylomarina sp. YFZ004]